MTAAIIFIVLIVLLVMIVLRLKIKLQIKGTFDKNKRELKVDFLWRKKHLYAYPLYTCKKPLTIDTFVDDCIQMLTHIKTETKSDFNFKNMELESLSSTTHIGTGNAATTGILTGGVWLVEAAILDVLQQYFVLKEKPEICVQPNFTTAVISVDFCCIGTIRLGKAIGVYVGLKNNDKQKETMI